MLEIGASGSMSGEGERGAAVWPKLPRLYPPATSLYLALTRQRAADRIRVVGDVIGKYHPHGD